MDCSCEGSERNYGEVQLENNNRAQISCEQKTKGERDYATPVNVEIDYEYFDRISIDIIINPAR